MTTVHAPRRRFLRQTGLAAATFWLMPRHVLGGARFVAPSATVNVALIGAGGQGRTNARALFQEKDARVVAVADPNPQADYTEFYYKGLAGRVPVRAEIEQHYGSVSPGFRCTEYEDYRLLLEKEKRIDAVLVATPDHWHASVTVAAMRLGKHVYCEKPLTHSLWEARLVARVARETGVATQMGNQGHSGDGIRTTCEWIRDGAIGPVREVHAWSHARKWFRHVGRPVESAPLPSGLNWDLWLGPRQPRPFHPSYAPVRWRSYWDFGGGSIADMACHNIDPAVWALDLHAPETVEASGCDLDTETVPAAGIYRYEFGARGSQPPVTLTWYDGGLMPARPAAIPEEIPLGAAGNGILLVGDRGVIMAPGWAGRPQLFPESLMDSYRRPAPTLPRSRGHHRDWLDACKGGPPASSHFEYAARLTEIVLLGNVALRAGRKIHWDPQAFQVRNVPDASRWLKGEYRPGWELT